MTGGDVSITAPAPPPGTPPSWWGEDLGDVVVLCPRCGGGSATSPRRPLIEPLVNHPHEHVRQAAGDQLKRIDRPLAKLEPRDG
jgi:hypothetical protein